VCGLIIYFLKIGMNTNGPLMFTSIISR